MNLPPEGESWYPKHFGHTIVQHLTWNRCAHLLKISSAGDDTVPKFMVPCRFLFFSFLFTHLSVWFYSALLIINSIIEVQMTPRMAGHYARVI